MRILSILFTLLICVSPGATASSPVNLPDPVDSLPHAQRNKEFLAFLKRVDPTNEMITLPSLKEMISGPCLRGAEPDERWYLRAHSPVAPDDAFYSYEVQFYPEGAWDEAYQLFAEPTNKDLDRQQIVDAFGKGSPVRVNDTKFDWLSYPRKYGSMSFAFAKEPKDKLASVSIWWRGRNAQSTLEEFSPTRTVGMLLTEGKQQLQQGNLIAAGRLFRQSFLIAIERCTPETAISHLQTLPAGSRSPYRFVQ